MMCCDYDQIITTKDDKAEYLALDTTDSFWNKVADETDIFFAIVFTIEMTFKVVAQGFGPPFCPEQGTYMSDPWNILDFVVVVTAWIPYLKIDMDVNLGAIRIFRVLRPLKSVNSLPELQKIIISMLKAIPSLLSVGVVLCFTYLVFGILGMQLYSGKLHQRCRLTPFPVTSDWQEGLDPLEYACLTPDAPNIKGKFVAWDVDSVRSHNVDLLEDNLKYTSKSESPWHGDHYRSCWWPIDYDNGYMCLMENPNKYELQSQQCYHGDDKDEWRWCGSDFDVFGNKRFKDDNELPFFDKALYEESFFWGYMNFDTLPRSLLTIFQCITMEGWSEIMYTAMDAKGYVVSYIYFFAVMLLGSFFALNLLLAVLEEAFDTGSVPSVITLRNHKGIYARYMGTYVKKPKDGLPRKEEGDEDYKVHGAVLYVKEEGDQTYYIYKSKVTGKWNMVDDEGDIDKNRSHFKSNRPSELPFDSTKKVTMPYDLPYDYSSNELHGAGDFVPDMFLQIHVENEDDANAHLLQARHNYDGNVDALLKTYDDFRSIADEATNKNLSKFIVKELQAVFASIMLKNTDERYAQLQKLLDKAQNMDDKKLVEQCQTELDTCKSSLVLAGKIKAPDKPVVVELTPKQKMYVDFGNAVEDPNGMFANSVTLLIVINTFVLALDMYPASPDYVLALDWMNDILSWIFALEMVVKISLLGFARYRADTFNLFDAFVVVMSFAEYMPGTDKLGGSAFTVLRSFRLFRIFKLARKWTAMHRLLALIYSTLIEVSYFLLLVILFIFIYAMIGVQFFANRMRFDDDGYSIPIGGTSPRTGQTWYDITKEYADLGGVEVPRANFDTTLMAFVTVYQILSGENWNAVMYDGWRATNDLSPWYFITLTIFGAMVVMNLFLAILLNNFGQLNESEFDEEEEESDSDDEEADVWGQAEKDVAEEGFIAREVIKADAEEEVVKRHRPGKAASEMETLSTKLQRAERSFADWLCAHFGWCGSLMTNWSLRPSTIRRYADERSSARIALEAAHEKANPGSAPETESIFPLSRGKTLNIFGPDNYLRQLLALIVDHPVCDNTVTFLIVLSTIFLVLDTPFLNPKGDLAIFLKTMDVIMTVLFTMEMVAKIIAMGFLFPKSAYLRNTWNILDFVVVGVSIVSLTPAGESIGWFRSIRTLRTLRPLRMINRNPALKLIVDVIIESVPGIVRVTLVLFLMFLIFAIFCVSFFKGKMKMCTGDHFEEVIAPSEMFYNMMEYPKRWTSLTAEEKSLFGPDSSAYSEDAMADDDWIANAAGWTEADGPVCQVWRKPVQTISSENSEMYGLREKAVRVRIREDKSPELPGGSDWKFDWEKDKPTSRIICECWGGEWGNIVWQDFDNTINSLLTLFEISTTEAWVDVMWAVVDSRGIDMQPVRDFYLLWTWFFMFFIFIGNYLFLNLFVGVTIDNFSDIKERKTAEGQSMFKTKSQAMWWQTYELSIKMLPKPRALEPEDSAGKFFFKYTITEPYGKWFDNFIMACIMLNTAIMALSFFGEDEAWTATCTVTNGILAIIFNLEMIAKIAAKREKYFEDQTDIFDFVIVWATNLGFILEWVGGGGGFGPVASVIRTFRIGRALRLMNTDNQMARDIRRLGMVLLKTLPGVLNITCLLLLLFIIFSVVGVQLFGKVALDEDHEEHTNFRDFFKTFMVLFRFATGENWNGFMHAVATYGTRSSDKSVTGSTQEAAECRPSDEVKYENSPGMCWFQPGWDCEPLDGCGNNAIIAYLILFNFAVAFMFINLFVGVILEGFENKDPLSEVVEEDMEWFKQVWSGPDFDPMATCFMSVDKLPEFTRKLICFAPESTSYNKIREEFGLRKNISQKNVSQKKLDRLLDQIHTGRTPINLFDGDKVYFKNVLLAFESQFVSLVSLLREKGEARNISLTPLFYLEAPTRVCLYNISLTPLFLP